MVHAEHVSLLPWVQIAASFRAHSKSFQENFDDCNCSSSEKRLFTDRSQQSFLVFFNKGGVKVAFLELRNGESASEELDVCWKSNHMVVFQSHVQSFDSLLTGRLVNDKF